MARTHLLQATQYAIFPALIVVTEADNGRKLIQPLPLEARLLLHWLWLISLNWSRQWLGQKTSLVTTGLSQINQRLTLEVRMGMILARTLAWGVLQGGVG